MCLLNVLGSVDFVQRDGHTAECAQTSGSSSSSEVEQKKLTAQFQSSCPKKIRLFNIQAGCFQVKGCIATQNSCIYPSCNDIWTLKICKLQKNEVQLSTLMYENSPIP